MKDEIPKMRFIFVSDPKGVVGLEGREAEEKVEFEVGVGMMLGRVVGV